MTALQVPLAVTTDLRRAQNRRRILVADDEPLVRALLALALAEAGYEVLEARDGVEALEVLDRQDCALVLLDTNMPNLSGRQVLERLRSNPRTSTLPVIVVTADDAVAERVSGLMAGADDYVMKPFVVDEVIARVRAKLRAHDAWRQALALHERQRALLSKAFAGAARNETLTGAASVLCNAIADQKGVASATIVRFGTTGQSIRLGTCGSSHLALDDDLVRRAAAGPWLDRDAHAVCAPLDVHDDGHPLGALVIELDGSHALDTAAALTGAIDCAAAISGLLRERLVATVRREHDVGELRALLDTGGFRPHFQPIVDLRSGEIVGTEALTRFSDGSSPADRFGEAAAVGLGLELELATLAAAVDEATRFKPPSAWLSLNVSPELMLSASQPAVREVLDLRDRDVVLELSERESVTDYEAVRQALRSAGDGVRWSIDDAGSGYASLRHILRLEPAFIKLDRSWVDHIDLDPSRQAMIAGLGHFADQTGAQLVAEGIERAEEREALVELGVALGQGFLLGRPAPLAA